MLTFESPRFEDRQWVQPLLAAEGSLGCEYNFTNIYLWSRVYPQKIARLGNRLLVEIRGKLGPCCLYPAGSGPLAPAVDALASHAGRRNVPLTLACVTREQRAALEEACPGRFAFEEDRGGFDCLLTVPAQAEPVSPMEYAELREGLLTGRTHTAYSSGQLAFQQFLCPHLGSGLYRLELAHGSGCAAVENWPEVPVVKELLCVPEDTGQGGAACAALCGRPVRARFPAADGQPFAAIRWLEGTPRSIRGATPDGWLGLAFD